MKPNRRIRVNKSRSSSTFRKNTRRTKGLNIAAPMRGGIRL